MNNVVEVALVARVGDGKVPVILAVFHDPAMLNDALRRATIAAAAERGMRLDADPDIHTILRGTDAGRIM